MAARRGGWATAIPTCAGDTCDPPAGTASQASRVAAPGPSATSREGKAFALFFFPGADPSAGQTPMSYVIFSATQIDRVKSVVIWSWISLNFEQSVDLEISLLGGQTVVRATVPKCETSVQG